MATDQGRALIARLEEDVARYQTPPFHLRHDLACAVSVHTVDAPEAVILYCARILEAMAPQVLSEFELPAAKNVFSNLTAFARYQLMEPVQLTWAHALRMLGNKVRHMTGELKQTDADLALFFTQCWLEWYFCVFLPEKKRPPALTSDRKALHLCTNVALEPVIEVVRDLQTDTKCTPEKVHLLCDQTRELTPVIPALLAYAMMGRGDEHFKQALPLLEMALEVHRDDLRLQQLVGLWHSWNGDLEKARQCLDPLYERYRDDDETAGILGGVYKRLAKKQQDRQLLERAHNIYRDGWEPEKDNPYLGINAAATALWLGRVPLARRTAEEVAALLSSAAAALHRHGRDALLKFDYWNQVTVPEAMLISGRLAEARRLYKAAFADHPTLKANFTSSRTQAVENLRALGLAAANDSWFEIDRELAGDGALRVAVTGHRKLADGAALSQQVRAVLQKLRGSGIAGHAPELVVLSALAEGADRLVAETALGEPFGGHLEVVLPLEVADYSHDFKTPQSVADFQRLLGLADVIHFPPPSEQPPDAESQRVKRKNGGGASQRPAPAPAVPVAAGNQRNAAYQWAGHEVVDKADVLIAIWNGQPASGIGGTGEIVAYAREHGRPLAWIHAESPHEVKWEREEMLSDK